jgi:hypothetical protein
MQRGPTEVHLIEELESRVRRKSLHSMSRTSIAHICFRPTRNAAALAPSGTVRRRGSEDHSRPSEDRPGHCEHRPACGGGLAQRSSVAVQLGETSSEHANSLGRAGGRSS